VQWQILAFKMGWQALEYNKLFVVEYLKKKKKSPYKSTLTECKASVP